MEKINIYKYSRLSQSEILNLCKRAESNLSDYFEIVDEIIKNVEENKENALVEYSKKLDKVKSGLQEFKVSEEEFSRAHDLIDEGMKEALIFCSANVKKFHEAQMPKKEWMIEMHPGVLAGEKNLPIETVALYVPRGKGSATLSAIGEAVIDGLTSVNAPGYSDTFSCDPRVLDVVGPAPIELDDSSHFLGLISSQFSANA